MKLSNVQPPWFIFYKGLNVAGHQIIPPYGEGGEVNQFDKFTQPKIGTFTRGVYESLSQKSYPSNADRQKKAEEITKKLEDAGFPVHFVKPTDRIDPKATNPNVSRWEKIKATFGLAWNYLFKENWDGKTLDFKVKDASGNEQVFNFNLEGTPAQLKKQVDDMYVAIPEMAKHRKGRVKLEDELRSDPQQHEKIMKELCKNAILTEVRKFLKLSSGFESRKKDWNAVLTRWDDVSASLAANKRGSVATRLGGSSKNKDYKGTSDQNLAFIEYYRLTRLTS